MKALMAAHIDVTVVTDTSDALVTPRSALVLVQLIGTVVDVSQAHYPSGVKTKITLTESDKAKDGQGGSRTLMVMESFQAVCMLIKHAGSHDHL